MLTSSGPVKKRKEKYKYVSTPSDLIRCFLSDPRVASFITELTEVEKRASFSWRDRRHIFSTGTVIKILQVFKHQRTSAMRSIEGEEELKGKRHFWNHITDQELQCKIYRGVHSSLGKHGQGDPLQNKESVGINEWKLLINHREWMEKNKLFQHRCGWILIKKSSSFCLYNSICDGNLYLDEV